MAVAIEVKPRLSRQDVADFLARLGKLQQAFSHYSPSLSNEVLSSLVNKGLKPLVCTSLSMKVLYANYAIYGAMTGIEIDEGVDRYAYQQGLFVIKQTGETVSIANDASFQPVAW